VWRGAEALRGNAGTWAALRGVAVGAMRITARSAALRWGGADAQPVTRRCAVVRGASAARPLREALSAGAGWGGTWRREGARRVGALRSGVRRDPLFPTR